MNRAAIVKECFPWNKPDRLFAGAAVKEVSQMPSQGSKPAHDRPKRKKCRSVTGGSSRARAENQVSSGGMSRAMGSRPVLSLGLFERGVGLARWGRMTCGKKRIR